MSDMIIAGNKVTIHFSTHVPIIGRVTYTPQATGDSWHITTDHGDVFYVQQFDYMLKLSDA
jgi:hypothetical protein